ncbi:MAG: DNA-directed RNA polymerase subunit A'', partial [Euryarchaeota archaeon]|nr:DNA-directed RNA polymerase subunit A'' [Euryarchaeota archaeon]
SKIEQKINALRDHLPDNIIEDLKAHATDLKLTEKELDKVINEIVKAYERALVEPAEAVGIIAAQSIGEPSTQMSLDYAEKIVIKNENSIKAVEIGKFVDNFIKKFGSVKLGESEVCDLPEDVEFFVPSLNQDEKIEWKRVLSCSRHKSPEKLIKIKTRSGRKIVATDSHSFVIRKDNHIVPISGKELRVGERVPAIKMLPENCEQFLDLNPIFDTCDRNSNKRFVNREGFICTINSKPLPAILELDKLFGWFIGAYLSEGNCTKYYISISNMNENFLSKTREFAKKFRFTYNEYDNFRGFSQGHDIHINSSLLSHMLERTCNNGSNLKKVPEFAYSADERFVAGLLRGYFDGDGNINVERGVIRVSSYSEELIDGMALLLTRFSIFANKLKEKGFWLTIPYKYAPTFLAKIGSDIKTNKGKLRKLSKLAIKSFRERSYDFVDMISGFGDIFYRIAKKLKYPTRFVNNFTKRQKIGRTTLYRYIKIFEGIAKRKNVDVEKELKILRKMFDADVVWDEIVEISYKKPKTNYVYDISVKGLETFATSSGIITHNTMRTFHYAGVAEINVTLGLPRLIEIVDARKTPSTPMMTIYLEENISKNLEKAKKVAKEIERVTIANVAKNIEVDFSEFRVVVELDEDRLKAHELTIDEIVEHIEKTIEESVHVRTNRIFIKLKKATAQEMRRLVTKIKEMRLKGVEGIRRIVLRKEINQYIIYTEGSNLADVLKIPGVDASRTYTNDINEVEEVLGIEAARNATIQEAIKTLDEQGLTVDLRHIMLVADMMTVDGRVKSIGRHGVSGEKASVLARASFEVTVDHLLNASLRGESDNLAGVIENVIVGQPVSLGTGTVELVMRQPKVK